MILDEMKKEWVIFLYVSDELADNNKTDSNSKKWRLPRLQ